MFKKYILSLALLSSIQQSHAQDDAQRLLQATCIVAVTAGAVALTYSTYARWLVKRAQAHFARERELLNHYGTYSAQYQSWTTHDVANLLRDLKTSIVYLHNTNRDRWDICVMYDIYNGNPAMYVNRRYVNFPLLQHVDDLNWYLTHLKIIRFLHAYPDQYELNALIEQLDYIKHMLLADHGYTQEAAMYNAYRR